MGILKSSSLFLFLILLSTGPAIAKDTWLPEFEPNVHVYVDPTLVGQLKFNDAFAGQVAQLAQKHQLAVYIIATSQGDELLDADRSTWAAEMLHNRLYARWKFSSGFREDNMLILLYIRSKTSLSGSIAVRAGSVLHGYGLDQSKFSLSDGPVLPAARQYMRVDPPKGFLAILTNINNAIDDHLAGKDKSEFSMPTWLEVVLIVLAIYLAICIICWLVRNSAGGNNTGSSGGSFFFFGMCGGGCGSGCSSCSGGGGASSCGGGGGGCGGGGSC